MPRRLSQIEFVALMAMIMSTIAFSIDAMLPALPEIAGELSAGSENRAQLILTFFLLGMGVGTLFTGMLSDRFGRKSVMLVGAGVYVLASGVAWAAQSLELMLAARLVQGLGAAGPRIVALAVIRDLYAGRGMAKIMSFVMMVFTIVPALAPLVGAYLISHGGWRAIFVAFVLFMGLACIWLAVRLPETLAVEDRRPMRVAALKQALNEMLHHPTVRLSVIVQTLCFGMLFSMLSSVQPIYDVTFGRGDEFPYWFFGVAILAGTGSLLNAALVGRLGMRFLVTVTLSVQLGISSVMVLLSLVDLPLTFGFLTFVVWQVSVFFQAGMTLGNLNALAMEPMGHIAGTAASVIGAISTVFSVVLAIPLGLMFDGTTLPLAVGICVMALASLLFMLHMRRVEARLPA
ncbi:multidrug effflux MFS transporter [Primorskyibacter sedentarius]|uniref:multidrug effflux MFS transporter n=1 Tax=Primorskyibacter sedentarius TaxID=745311 RepID=UPI003EB8AA9E